MKIKPQMFIELPPNLYDHLKALAKKQKVSIRTIINGMVLRLLKRRTIHVRDNKRRA